MNTMLLQSFAGGLLIGLAALLLLFLNGKIAGISGIAAGLLKPLRGDTGWRICFIGGMILGAVLTPLVLHKPLQVEINTPLPLILLGGFLVGLGTRIGSGCTSGHGVCGIARLSARSLLATALFMLSAIITVFVARHLL